MNVNVYLYFGVTEENLNSKEKYDVIKEFDDCKFVPSHDVIPCTGDMLQFNYDDIDGTPDYWYEAENTPGISSDEKTLIAMHEIYSYNWKVNVRTFSGSAIFLDLVRDKLINS